MTLVERLREVGGGTGDYEWSVEVWRSDTLALANLRVRLSVYRVRRRWILPNTRRMVYRETEVAGPNTVDDHVQEAQEKARQIVARFEGDRKAVDREETIQ